MRIVHVIENYMPDSRGGTEVYVAGISEHLLSRGHEIHVIAPRVAGARESYVYEGVKVHRYAIPEKVSKNQYKGLEAPAGLDNFIEIVKGIEPDIVHFHTFNRSINAYHLRGVSDLGIKTVFTPHQGGIFCASGTMLKDGIKRCSGDLNCTECVRCKALHEHESVRKATLQQFIASILPTWRWLRKKLPARFYIQTQRREELCDINRWADVNIALSNWVEDTFSKNNVSNVRLVPQGINSTFRPLQTESFTDGVLKIIFVGRIDPVKDLETVCSALEKLDSNKIAFTVACVKGDSEYYKALKKRVLALRGTPQWVENSSPEKLNRMISASDFLILASKSEMSPLVVLESFACGTPVIGSDIPPITDQVKSGINGVVFKVGDADKLASLLKEIAEDRAKCLKLREQVTAPRTFKDVAHDLESSYSSL